MTAKLTPEQRFWAKVDRTDDCWIWTAKITRDGYGCFVYNGKFVGAHRVSYEFWSGQPIPSDMDVDHRCFTKACVNPSHLRLATRSQNAQNRRGAQSNCASGIRGVRWEPRHNKWFGAAIVEGKKYYTPLFQDISQAEQAVIELRNRLMTHNDQDRIGADA